MEVIKNEYKKIILDEKENKIISEFSNLIGKICDEIDSDICMYKSCPFEKFCIYNDPDYSIENLFKVHMNTEVEIEL